MWYRYSASPGRVGELVCNGERPVEAIERVGAALSFFTGDAFSTLLCRRPAALFSHQSLIGPVAF
jgi:hypothetical protein